MTQNAVVQLLVMGVAGCGKSTLAARIAQALGVPLIEGDEHHSPQNRAKMQQGIALDDLDRAPWLEQLGGMVAASHAGAVLSCSALRRHYRASLRRRVPGLATVFIDIDPELARDRVAARAGHLFPTSLVGSQFASLEPPVAEPNVLRMSASQSLTTQLGQVLDWLGRPTHQPAQQDLEEP